MALAKLSIDLEAQLATLQRDLDKANRLVGQQTDLMTARFQGLQRAASAVGAAFAGALSVGAVGAFVQRTVAGLTALKGLSEATGASVENLSALEAVALRSGTSVDTMGSALVRFNQELAKAERGSEVAGILQRIGLDAQQLRQVDPAEALRRVSAALVQYRDDGERARVVQQLFGRSVGDVAGFLRDLAEQQQLQATVTREQVEQADRLNKQMAALGERTQVVARAFAGPLIQAMDTAIERFARTSDGASNLTERVEKLWNFLIRLGSFGMVRGLPETDSQQIESLTKRLAELRAEQAALEANTSAVGESPVTRGLRRRLEADIEQLTAQRDGLIRRFLVSEQGYGAGAGLPAIPSGARTTGSGTRTAAPGVLAPAGLSASLQDALSAVDQTRIAQVERLSAAMGELFALRGSGIGGDGGIDAAIEDLRDRLAALDPAQRQAVENQRRLNELLASTPSGQQAALVREVEFVNQAYSDGKISVEQWAELQRQATAKLPQDLQQAVEQMSETAKQFQRNVQDLLGSTISRSLRGDFQDIGEAWKNMLIDMAAQAAAANLGQRLFGKDGKSGWWATFASAVGFANGGAFAQGQPVTAFADGGILTRATPFMYGGGRLGVAGEAGPEAVLPLRRGRDGKLGVGGGGGFTVVNQVAAGVSRGDLVTALQLSSQETFASVMRELRRQRVL